MAAHLRKGDIVYLDFTPQSGHEQAGRRPGVVVSRTEFNSHSNMACVCPVTHTQRDFPTHVQLPDGLAVNGYVLCEQAKFLDCKSRNAEVIGALPLHVMDTISDILHALL